MDKTAIKNFAIEARRSLIAGIKLRAATYGITENKIDKRLPASTNEIEYYVDDRNPLIGSDIAKRQKLVDELNRREKDDDLKTAFNDLVEEVAYTWFNRLIAIRFMEVNDYLPSRTRVLSSSQGRRDPDIMQDPVSLEEWLGRFNDEERALIKKAHESESTGDMDTLYRMLFIKQANALNDNLPKLFEKTNDYAELLFTPNYHDGVIQHLITDIDEADFDVTRGGQVEIIGWLYQYYNTENKEQAINSPKTHKFRSTEVASATQIFTPDWIVKYMVQNSLGKRWIQHLIAQDPSRNEATIAHQMGWNYYMPDAQQSESVINQITRLDSKLINLKVTDLKMIDPAMGSGHILVYAFEVFMNIYESEGYSQREASLLIIQDNLYGTDIDERAFQLTYFAVMMKARQFNRRSLKKINKVNLYSMPNFDSFELNDFEILLQQMHSKNAEQLKKLIFDFGMGEDLGSLIIEDQIDFVSIQSELKSLNDNQLSFELIPLIMASNRIIDLAKLFSQSYDVVIANPPYMGSSRMNTELTKFAKSAYPNSKSDLFAMFIERWNKSVVPGGYNCMVTMQSWMFLSSFEKMRKNLLAQYTISNLMHMENNVMGIAFGTAVVILRNSYLPHFIGTYHQIKTQDTAGKIPSKLPISGNRFNRTNQANFSKIPGSPIAYWISDTVFNLFRDSKKIKDVGFSKKGLDTGNNAKYYRYWFEVMHNSNKWVPLNKGGNYRKWYGNHTYVINWEDNGQLIKNNGRANIRNEKFYFMESISWTDLTSGPFSSRLTPQGFIFDASGPSYFGDNLIPMLAYMNSKVFNSIAQVTMSTMHYTNGQVAQMPYIENIDTSEITKIAENNVEISKREWNSFEISWEFLKHPLVIHIADDKRTEVAGKLENAFKIWQQESKDRFDQLRSNEEELNRIFINLYGLNDELTPEVADKDVSVSLANEVRDIKSFLSYFVGIVFGRYSLDKSGLVFAGGNWDPDQYQAFKPNRDNLLILNDEQYYNDDRDIINRLKEFLGVTFGVQNIATNLDYIASVIGKRGASSEEQIRKYFVEDFFKDHKKVYQKRPIYWEFNSGKKNGFKALMYLHRYDRDELAMIRSDYLHSLQGCYEKRVNQLEQELSVGIVPREKKNLDKKVKTISAQINEIKEYDSTIQHLANKKIELDLDDGVLVNYAKLQDGFNILSKL
ncbi:BREX-1 system adenine-specific DNA-methyltransferase PglX [Lactiplantibacillus paraxiangfangensis]|uniref:BREX-1 system adenine-specific DNA-methyltransferase PglX n=1 Tax=Lactiplantibacillus paraxiangfangensis TaxID=3076224 RepID=UPI0030C6868F